MISASLLKILVCPENKMSLEWADPSLLADLNRKIQLKQVFTKKGVLVTIPLEGGLLRKDRAVLYPIRNQIPMLLIDESIALGL